MTVRTAPASASDAALIAQTRLGDDAAYATLAARHSPALVRLAHVFQEGTEFEARFPSGSAHRV